MMQEAVIGEASNRLQKKWLTRNDRNIHTISIEVRKGARGAFMHSTRPYTRKFAFLPSPVTNRASIDDFALRQSFLLPMTIRNKNACSASTIGTWQTH